MSQSLIKTNYFTQCIFLIFNFQLEETGLLIHNAAFFVGIRFLALFFRIEVLKVSLEDLWTCDRFIIYCINIRKCRD